MLNYYTLTLVFAIERNFHFVDGNIPWNVLSKFVRLHLYNFPFLYFIPFSQSGYKIKGNLSRVSMIWDYKLIFT